MLSRRDEVGAAAAAANHYMDHAEAVARVEAEAREAAGHLESYQSTFDRHGIVLVVDHSGGYVHANDGFCAFTGHAREELQAGALVKLCPPPGENLSVLLRNMLVAGHGDIEIRTKSGEQRWLAMALVRVTDKDGAAKQIVAISHDITARVVAERAAGRKQEIGSLISRMWSLPRQVPRRKQARP